MADTLDNTNLTPGAWLNLNTATGIAVGTKIIIQNLSRQDVYIVQQVAKPTGSGFNIINPKGQLDAWMEIKAGGNDVWASVRDASAVINVQED